MSTASSGSSVELSCHRIEVSYGAVQVLFGVDLEVSSGEIVALLGTNGAGKSTLISTITGELSPRRGTIHLDGRDITHVSAAERAAMGIASAPGGRAVFGGLTVAENLRVASWIHRRDFQGLKTRTAILLELFPSLADRLYQQASSLSGGEQQMLALAQAFIGKPRLLLVDELSIGLAPLVVAQLAEALKAIHAQGTTIVAVEQSLNVALHLSDRAVFMEKGEVRFDGPARELMSRPDMLRSVFLARLAQPAQPVQSAQSTESVQPARPAQSVQPAQSAQSAQPDPLRATPVLEGRNLHKSYGGIMALHDVSVTLGPGEIVGLIGPNGAGKTTLFDLLTGFARPDSGRVFIDGVDVTRYGPERRARHGLGRSFQSARLFRSLSVAETLAVACDMRIDVRDPISTIFALPVARAAESATRGRVNELIELTGLGPYAHTLISELSVGTRRIVDIACGLAHSPSALLLDEPATGIAQREAEALAPALRWLSEFTGAGLLVVEHDMGLITSVADRLVVLVAGSEIGSGQPAEVASDPQVIMSLLGTDGDWWARSGPVASGTEPLRGPR